MADRQLKVPPIIQLTPLQLPITRDQRRARVDGPRQRYVLPTRARRADRCARKLYADGPRARRRVVRRVVQPDEVGDPVCVAVAGDHDVVADLVVVQGGERAVAVALVAVPGVVVERVDVAVRDALVDAREDGLRPDDTPGGAAICGLHEGVVEPIFLAGAQHAAAGVVADLAHVVGVPVEVGDGAIVLAGVEHDEVEEGAELEGAPDAQIVVHFDLTDWHPLEVGTDGVHFPLVRGYAAVLDEGGFGVVEVGGCVAVGVIGDFVVIPDRNPSVLLVRKA